MGNLRFSKYQLRVNNPDSISDIDALEPVQSQYAASPRILGLLVRKAALLDPGKDLMEWYDSVFNLMSTENHTKTSRGHKKSAPPEWRGEMQGRFRPAPRLWCSRGAGVVQEQG